MGQFEARSNVSTTTNQNGPIAVERASLVVSWLNRIGRAAPNAVRGLAAFNSMWPPDAVAIEDRRVS